MSESSDPLTPSPQQRSFKDTFEHPMTPVMSAIKRRKPGPETSLDTKIENRKETPSHGASMD